MPLFRRHAFAAQLAARLVAIDAPRRLLVRARALSLQRLARFSGVAHLVADLAKSVVHAVSVTVPTSLVASLVDPTSLVRIQLGPN